MPIYVCMCVCVCVCGGSNRTLGSAIILDTNLWLSFFSNRLPYKSGLAWVPFIINGRYKQLFGQREKSHLKREVVRYDDDSDKRKVSLIWQLTMNDEIRYIQKDTISHSQQWLRYSFLSLPSFGLTLARSKTTGK